MLPDVVFYMSKQLLNSHIGGCSVCGCYVGLLLISLYPSFCSQVDAKRKHDKAAYSADLHSHRQGGGSKVSSAALQPKLREPQQLGKELKHAKRDTAFATLNDSKPRKQLSGRPQIKSEGLAARNEVASAGSNPSTSATKDRDALQEAVSVQQHHRVKIEEHSTASGPVPVEVEPRPSAKPQLLGDIVPSSYSSYEELVGALHLVFGERLPKKAGLRLVYQDIDGDWLLLLPDVPWPLFLSTVRRLLITYK